MQLSNHQLNQIKTAFNACKDDIETHDVMVELNMFLLQALADWPVTPLMYFSKPNQTIQYVGIGSWAMMDNREAQEFLNETPSKKIHLFGGNAFNKTIPSSDWQAECWVLPKIMIIQTTTETVCRFIFDKRQKENTWKCLEKVLQQLCQKQLSGHQKQDYQSLDHHPNKEDWEKAIGRVTKDMANRPLKKVVLARETWVSFPKQVNPFLMMSEIQENDPKLFHFVVKLSGHSAFIGGTPERLFELTGQEVESEAIAGTVKNVPGNSELLSQEKEAKEHQYVADFIQATLKNICVGPMKQDVSPSILELKYLCHLIQKFNGTLKPGVGPIDTLDALHPTPAVAGTPTQLAMTVIDQTEPFSRDWYAGPIGVLSSQKSIVVVAIRSGKVSGKQVILYAGAGIINASNPELEWQELDAKIVGFTEVFKPK